jgi:hypothetical protein
MEKVSEYSSIIEDIDRVVGSGWANPRARVYIAATLSEHKKAIEELKDSVEEYRQALMFERAVNQRVHEVIKALVGVRNYSESPDSV